MQIGSSGRVLAALAVSLLGVGCGGPDIRVVNESTYTVTDLQISSPSETQSYGTLAPGESSEHLSFAEAYDRAAATFIVGNYRLEIPPPDWDTREELDGGDWTYHLNVVDLGQGLAEILATED
jgi:hypothetical protein